MKILIPKSVHKILNYYFLILHLLHKIRVFNASQGINLYFSFLKSRIEKKDFNGQRFIKSLSSR